MVKLMKRYNKYPPNRLFYVAKNTYFGEISEKYKKII